MIHSRRRSLQDRYRLLRIRLRAYEQERDRAEEGAENDRYFDMVCTITRIKREIREVLEEM